MKFLVNLPIKTQHEKFQPQQKIHGMNTTNLAPPGCPSPSSFRLTAKKFMLTYKTHVDKEALHAKLRTSLRQDFEIKIAHETSEDGYPHTHAVVCLSRKPDIKNARFFDIESDADRVHPNITIPTSTTHWQHMVTYLDKQDTDVYGNITVKLSTVDRFTEASNYVLTCTSLPQLFRCPDPEIAMTIASRLPYFQRMWETCGPKTLSKSLHSTFSRPFLDLTSNWLITGPPGTGKTQFALAHFKEPCLVSHIDDLKNITSTTDGIVFDDMSFKQYPSGSIIHLLDKEVTRTIHARYFNAVIPANLPKIFTNNRDDIFVPEKGCTEDEQAAIDRRFKILRVSASLF